MSSATPTLIGRSVIFASDLPLSSQISSTDPKLETGTSYEKGLSMRVTRTYLPSGARSIARIIAGDPTRLIVPFATSISASWPVACHSRSCSW